MYKVAINPILWQNEISKIPDIQKDYQLVQEKLGIKSCSSTSEPPWWGSELENEVAERDFLCVKALTSMAILNGPTDVDSLYSAWNQIKSGFKNKTPDGYDPKIAQHPFSFFRGTVLHEYLNPNSEKCINKNWAKKVIKKDVSLMETKFGGWILNKLGVDEIDKVQSNIKDISHTENKPRYVNAKVFKSKNAFGDLTARALSRTSKYGVYALTGLGALHAAHEIAEGENIFKEVSKTALQVGTTLASVGYLGAIGYKHLGTFGSLLGIGLGTTIGTQAPKLFFK